MNGTILMRRAFLILATLVALAGCSSPNGLLVSDGAMPVGGNLFVETAEDGTQHLVLDGVIEPETAFSFDAFLDQADVAWLVIAQSPGGDLVSAHQMGNAIRRKGISTAVIAACYSACVDVFIAGHQREMIAGSELMLHAASDREIGLALDRPYWSRMGFADVNERAYTVPDGAWWRLSHDRALSMRMATRVVE